MTRYYVTVVTTADEPYLAAQQVVQAVREKSPSSGAVALRVDDDDGVTVWTWRDGGEPQDPNVSPDDTFPSNDDEAPVGRPSDKKEGAETA